VNHPGDTVRDPNLKGDFSVVVERPIDIKRLIDFMLAASPAASHIDPKHVGFFGFSRGGYTGLVLVGATPDWGAAALDLCQDLSPDICDQLRRAEYPAVTPTRDPRIKAVAVADPLAIVLTRQGLQGVTTSIQLWASERGGDGVSPDIAVALDRDLPQPHEFHVVPNSAHFVFLTPCSPALAEIWPELCTDAPGFDRAAFHKQLNSEMLAFFRKHLVQP
jgi:predicted dienelactone hydrolase